ncbi:hypothetical protein [Salinimonas chungwhensis]|uniref:hypothetical protein n=1 Tax=Salinimonas chungwhensis TaxID=265425 RepID=UPI000363A612|nr:hypothetical protein [Salinimonas chungwhensis]
MTKQTYTKRLTFFGVLVAFVVPVLIAKVALDNNWFNRGSTNNGELIQPVVDFSAALDQQPPKWRLVYRIPSRCEASCQNAIYSIQQVWLALGRETDRAQATLIVTETSDPEVVSKLDSHSRLKIVNTNRATADKRLKQYGDNSVYLVDTLNQAMLRYAVSADREEAVLNSRDILADVKKLMKLSRIG